MSKPLTKKEKLFLKSTDYSLYVPQMATIYGILTSKGVCTEKEFAELYESMLDVCIENASKCKKDKE